MKKLLVDFNDYRGMYSKHIELPEKNLPEVELGKWYRLKNSVQGMSGFGRPIVYERGELVMAARIDDETSDVWVAMQRHICGGHLEFIALAIAKRSDLKLIHSYKVEFTQT